MKTATAYETLTLAQKFAPTGVNQVGFTMVHHDAVKDGLSDLEVSVMLLRSLLDGLDHGNWPV